MRPCDVMGRDRACAIPVAAAASSVALIALEMRHPAAAHAPALSATIGTSITLSAVACAWLMCRQFNHTRRLRDLLLLGALTALALVTLTSDTLPVVLALEPAVSRASAMLGAALVAAVVAIAAFARPDRQVSSDSRWVVAVVGASVMAVALADLGGWLLHGLLADAVRQPESRIAAAARDAPALGLGLGTTIALILAAVGFARNRPADDLGGTGLWAAAATLLAATPISYLALPALAPDWVTPRDGLRIAGAALILAALVRQESELRRAVARSAVMDERRRLARDLHDGLAQDLAFIVAHGDRLARDAGREHPVAIAARRALTISRGAMADLSAADAPSTGEALRQVADELSARFEINVDVEVEEVSVSAVEREDVVRIAREAVVNAARHGAARNVSVSLGPEAERFVLRVRDDGCGMRADQQTAHAGFGLLSMSERAAALGGPLISRKRVEGGTELEVPVP